jgi:hypothetical protein
MGCVQVQKRSLGLAHRLGCDIILDISLNMRALKLRGCNVEMFGIVSFS